MTFVAKTVYQVSNIEEISAPDNSDENNWYQYTISNNASTISGQRKGTRNQVLKHAEEFADQLNERKQGKTNSVYAPRKKQQKNGPSPQPTA